MSTMSNAKNGLAMRRLMATHSRQESIGMACPTLRPRRKSAGTIGAIQAQPEDPRKIFLLGKKKLGSYVKKAGANSPYFLKERLLTSRLLYRIAKDILAKPRTAAATTAAASATFASTPVQKSTAEKQPLVSIMKRRATNESSATTAPASLATTVKKPTLVMCGQIPVIMSAAATTSSAAPHTSATVTNTQLMKPAAKKMSAFAHMSTELQKALPAARRSISNAMRRRSSSSASSASTASTASCGATKRSSMAKIMSQSQASWEQLALSRCGSASMRRMCQI